MRVLVGCTVALGLVLAGCTKTRQRESKAAVQAAIEAHLQQRPNLMLTNLTFEIQDVTFTGDTARPK